jgi:hypothetical protein
MLYRIYEDLDIVNAQPNMVRQLMRITGYEGPMQTTPTPRPAPSPAPSPQPVRARRGACRGRAGTHADSRAKGTAE